MIPLFKQLKKDNPSVIPIGNTFFLDGLDKFDYILGAGTPGAVRMDDKTCTVINQFEDKDFLDILKRTREIFVDKLTYQDVKLQTTSTDKDFRAGKLACFVHRCPPFSAEGATRTYGFPVFTVPIFKNPVVTTSCISGSFVAIATHSKNPVRAMKFLNLLNTDPYLHNLLCFGIENMHYTKLPNGQIHITPAGVERYSIPTWTLGNMFLEYVPDTEPADKWAVTKQFNADSVLSPLFGFGYDPEPIQAEISALSNISGQYGEQLQNGACDIDATAAEYTKKAKSAGMDKMFTELQKQIDKWKTRKK